MAGDRRKKIVRYISEDDLDRLLTETEDENSALLNRRKGVDFTV